MVEGLRLTGIPPFFELGIGSERSICPSKNLGNFFGIAINRPPGKRGGSLGFETCYPWLTSSRSPANYPPGEVDGASENLLTLY